MTVSSTVRRSGPYNGNGSTTTFAYGFKVFEDTSLQVVKTVGGSDSVVSPSEYSVTGVGASGGGNIVFTIAPPSGTKITIIGNEPFTQSLDLENQGAYYADDVEKAFDRAAMRDLQLEERLDRAVQIPVGADPATLPPLIEDIIRLAGSVANVDIVADNIDAVNTVAPLAATIATNIADIVTVATNVADVSAVADSMAAVTTLSPLAETITNNLSDIHNFSDVYQGSKSSDPTVRNDGSSLEAGDLYFSTSTNQMRVYTGSEWRDASADGLVMSAKSFVGDGVGTSFMLDTSPASAANVIVWVGGVRQVPMIDYSVLGSNVVFASAPGAVAIDTLMIAPSVSLPGALPLSGGTMSGDINMGDVSGIAGVMLKFYKDGYGISFPGSSSILALTSALAYRGKGVDGRHLFRDNENTDVLDLRRDRLRFYGWKLDEAVTFQTVAEAQAYAPWTAPEAIRTMFYDSNKVSGGGGIYTKVASQPSHDGKFSLTTRQGATVWYELFSPEAECHPEQFGARRNGSVDDGPAFNKAAVYLNATGGGVVKAMPGEYLIGTSVQSRTGVVFEGAAFRRTTLRSPSTGTSGGFFFFGVGLTSVGVNGFLIVGDRGTAAVNQNANAINFSQCNNVIVYDNELQNIRGTGIFVGSISGVEARGAYIFRNVVKNAYWGICAFKGASDIYIDSNRIETCQSNGIIVDDATNGDNPGNADVTTRPASCQRVFVTNNRVYNACSVDFGAAINFAGVTVGLIQGNHIERVGASVGGQGINISSGQDGWFLSQIITVTGNTIWEVYGNGLNMQGGALCSITGNVFVNIDASGGGGASFIYCIPNTSANNNATIKNTISGNHFNGITARSQVGITLASGVTDTWIGLNNYAGCTAEINNAGGTTNKKASYVNA